MSILPVLKLRVFQTTNRRFSKNVEHLLKLLATFGNCQKSYHHFSEASVDRQKQFALIAALSQVPVVAANFLAMSHLKVRFCEEETFSRLSRTKREHVLH